MAKSILPLVLFWLAAAPVFAQKQPPPLLNVFLDFYNPPFEPGFLKSEIGFVNYVRDPALCDVQVQQTTELPGNDARRAMLFFFGRGRFEGQNDTASFVIQPAENQGIVRERLLRTFKKGLLKYLLQTEWAASIDYALPGADNAPVRDGWNLWTYNVDFGGYLNSNSANTANGADTKLLIIDGRAAFRAYHVGQTWRKGGSLTGKAVNQTQRYSNYRVGDRRIDSVSRTNSNLIEMNWEIFYALGDRLSIGQTIHGERVYRQNYNPSTKYHGQMSFGAEYSFFPYSDFFRRRFVAGYFFSIGRSASPGDFYDEPPRYLPSHNVYFQYARIEKWGFIYAIIESLVQYKKFIHLFRAHPRLDIGLNMRKGLFLTFNVSHSTNIHQNKFGSGNPPVLITYTNIYQSLSSSVGVSYYFGSGYQNIINPRMNRLSAVNSF